MGDRHRVQLEPGLGGGKVSVDGVDISSGVRGVRLDLAAGHLPQLTLDLVTLDVAPVEADDVQVFLPPATREALVALGWTPPPEA